MSEETVTPASPEAVEVAVSDTMRTAKAVEGLLDFGDEPEQPEPEQPPEDEEQEEAEEADSETETLEADETGEAENEDASEISYETLVEVTLPGGNKQQVTLDELQKSYSREADYTRKTEVLSAERRDLAAERDQMREAVQTERQQYFNSLQQLTAQAGNELANEAAIDWQTLRDEDPIEFAAQWADHQRKTEALNRSQHELQVEQQRRQHETQEQHNEFLANQQAQLSEVMPDFVDPEKGEKLRGDLRTFMRTHYGGFSDDEISSVADARHVQLISDAMRWRELQSNAPGQTKKVAKLPRVVRPTSPRPKVDRDAEGAAVRMKRARSSGSVNDAAAAIADLL